MSIAVTLPDAPTLAASHSVMLPLPPPSSRQCQPSPTPSVVRYPRVQGSKIFDIRSRRWYSTAEASSRMYGFMTLLIVYLKRFVSPLTAHRRPGVRRDCEAAGASAQSNGRLPPRDAEERDGGGRQVRKRADGHAGSYPGGEVRRAGQQRTAESDARGAADLPRGVEPRGGGAGVVVRDGGHDRCGRSGERERRAEASRHHRHDEQ